MCRDVKKEKVLFVVFGSRGCGMGRVDDDVFVCEIYGEFGRKGVKILCIVEELIVMFILVLVYKYI